MTRSRTLILATVLLVAGTGCGSAEEFESDNPQARPSSNARGMSDSAGAASSSSGGMASPGTAEPSQESSSKDAERAIEEADLVKIDGDRLYALSQYGGLSIVDMSNPDQLRLLGRFRTDGTPFEMYVRNGTAYVMMNDWGHYVTTPGAFYGRYVSSSEILALDVTNPAQVRQSGQYEVPGSISDSRVVGDALYLVTFEDSSCWGCNSPSQATVVTSFGIAPGSISKVDQITYSGGNNYSWSRRSVSATNERMYIAGPSWSWNGQGTPSSVIQVIDIHDPTGHMVKGADVPVAGQITSRWQMDEYNGILRVVSQQGNTWGNNSMDPKVQTFQVASASQITSLGSTSLHLPHPESLRSVRFDGTRGYAITAQQKDPLYTIDLSNPAQPKQMAELVMPGWIYHMEPMGDRLIGFGYEDNRSLQASLFDVSDLSKPTMLKRVYFGEGFGQFAEDQDRMHKAVQILPEQNLLLIPFASYGRWDGTNCSQGKSGIQIIDMTHDDLKARGVAPQYGMPKRAFMHKDRLFGVSDRNVSGFRLDDRDAPTKSTELDLSNPAYKIVSAGANVVSITNDWWTGEAMLSITPKANIENASILGRISLAELAPRNQYYCNGFSSWASWYEARVFVNGQMAYVAVPVSSYSEGSREYGRSVILAAIDMSDTSKPRIVGKTTVKLASNSMYYGNGFLDGYGYYSWASNWFGALIGSGSAIVSTGTKVAFLDSSSRVPDEVQSTILANTNSTPTYDRTLYVVDFANPTAPTTAAPMALTSSKGVTPLLLQGSTVYTSRWSEVPGQDSRVRFYVDRVSLAGQTPSQLGSVSVPGSLLSVDAQTGRMVTVDYRRTVRSVSNSNDCYGTYAGYYYDVYFDSDESNCIEVSRSLKLLDIDGNRATVRHVMPLTSRNIGGVRAEDDRIYVTRYPVYDYRNMTFEASPSGSYQAPKLLAPGGVDVIGGIRAGQFQTVSRITTNDKWPLGVDGTRIALLGDGGMTVYDTKTSTPKMVGQATLRGYGYGSDILFEGDKAYCAVGEWGFQSVQLTSNP